MEINITPFFTQGIAPMDLSASVAEIGPNAGAYTWQASCEAAADLQLLKTPDQLDAFRDFAQSAGMELEPEECTPSMLNALFLQWVAGDLRQMGVDGSADPIDWAEVEAAQSEGVAPSNIFRGVDGQIYFYAGS